MATLKQIAEAAGVSIRTVSRVLYQRPNIAPETQAKVQKAIDRLGYTPNLLARSLKNKRRNMLGIIIDQLNVPVLIRKLDILQRRSYSAGFQTLIGITESNEAKEDRFVKEFAQFTDGLLFLNTPHADSLVYMKEHDVSYVLVDSYNTAEPSVSIDRAAGVRQAIRANQHHYPCLAFITPDTNPQEPRHQAFLQETGGKPAFPVITTEKDGFTGGYVAGDRIASLATPCLAVCYSDRVAMGLMKRLYELDIKIPEQVGVVGFDDDIAGAYQYKALSTVSQSISTLAERSLDLLATILNNEKPEAVSPVKTEYIKRDTTL